MPMSIRTGSKPILGAIRRMLGRKSTQPVIGRSDPKRRDAGGEEFLTQDSVSSVSSPSARAQVSVPKAGGARKVGMAGINLIKQFEGCARLRRDGLVEAYPDPGTGAEPWTIGWGATGTDYETGERIAPGTTWTQAKCDERLAQDLRRYAAEVAKAIGKAATTQTQFDALVSFHYNTGAIARATLTKKHVAGDHAGAASEFARWNKAGGRVLKGLVRRRAEEAKLYLS